MHWLLRAFKMTSDKQLAHQVHPGEASFSPGSWSRKGTDQEFGMLSLWWGATYNGAIWIFLTSFWASGPSALKQKNSEWSWAGPSHSATPSLSCLILSALFLFSFHLKLLIAWILFFFFCNLKTKHKNKQQKPIISATKGRRYLRNGDPPANTQPDH